MAKQKTKYNRLDSGLFVPDDRFVLPERRPAWDSSRGMGQRRCCCNSETPETCTVFESDFSTDDLSVNWTQVSGSWSITDGVLSTSDSNAVLICNKEWQIDPTSFHNHVVQVSLQAVTGNRSRIVFSYNATAETYNYVEIYWNGTSSYVYFKTSGGSTIATSAALSFTNGTTYAFKLCVASDSAVVNYTPGDPTSPRPYVTSATMTSTTTSSGLGTGSIVSQESFTSFSIKTHDSEVAGCELCSGLLCTEPCINGLTPEWFQVTISGVQSSNCDACLALNRTYMLHQIGSCGWTLNGLNIATCSGCLIEYISSISAIVNYNSYNGVAGYYLIVTVYATSTRGCCDYPSMWFYLGTSQVDCTTIDMTQSPSSSITSCGCIYPTSMTVRIKAV